MQLDLTKRLTFSLGLDDRVATNERRGQPQAFA